MEMRPRLKVSSDRLVKPGIKPTTPSLEVIKLEFILRLKIKQAIIAFYFQSETVLKIYNLNAWTRPRLKVLSERLVKPGIKPTTPGLEVLKLEFILRLKIKQPIIAFYF